MEVDAAWSQRCYKSVASLTVGVVVCAYVCVCVCPSFCLVLEVSFVVCFCTSVGRNWKCDY